jgi:alpha-tubulin suppressor-like RCC1 family protein
VLRNCLTSAFGCRLATAGGYADSASPGAAGELQAEAAERPSGMVWAWGGMPTSKGPDTKGLIREIQDKELIREIQDVVAVAAGSTTSYALTKSGNVWAWGHGPWRLGAGTEEDQSTPVRVKGLSEVTAISASFHHCLALKRDGTVWAWGRNARGQLGDGTRESRNVPVQAKGIKDVVAVSAGRSHSCVLRNDGTVWAWGDNHYGQCTESNDVFHCRTPVQMAGLSDVIAISNGYTHNLALRKDGTVWQWGYLARKCITRGNWESSRVRLLSGRVEMF